MAELSANIDRVPAAVVPAKTLRVVRHLLTRLHENGVTYCHWKSNEHVGAGLQGLTDLDILVERVQSHALERVLVDVGFKRFLAPPLRRYSGIEDYLAYDSEAGRLVHLHLHYQLTIGEAHLKGYRVPWECELLHTRQFDSEHEIFVADPALELLLLLVRAALKRRWRDPINQLFGQGRTTSKTDFQREFEFLCAKADRNDVVGVTLRLLGPTATQSLVGVLDKPYSRKEMGDFALIVRAQLRLHRTFGPMTSALRRWVREFHWLLDGLSRRYLHQATPRRRLSPRGGIVIVLLGSDGAGKSTQSKVLIDWLSKKLDVIPIYFGSGDGPSSLYRMPLRWGQRLIGATPADRSRKNSISEQAQMKTHDGREAKTVRSYLHTVARPIWALALAREKRSKIRQMVRARNRGMAVVCDRFPQSDVVGFNDGPLLAHWRSHSWQICRWLSVWESQPYTNAAKTCPDLVIRLTIDPIAAQQRRPEMSFAGLQRRVAAVKCMKFAKETAVVDIDAEMSIDEVSAAIKRHTWSKL